MKIAPLLFACAALAGCYEMSSVRVPARSPSTTLGCPELADQVFFEAGYTKVSSSTGAMVYSPRGPALSRWPMPFHWGIGVWKPERATWSDAPGVCEYELQALSADPNCSALQCPMTPQPGAEYDEETRRMAQRLRTTAGAAVSMSGRVRE